MHVLFVAPPSGTSDAWSALVAALVHSLWQAGLIGGLLAVTLGRLPARRSVLRAALGGAAQIGVLLAFALTWAVLNRSSPAPSLSGAEPASVTPASGEKGTDPVQLTEPRAADPLAFRRNPVAPRNIETARRLDWAGLVGGVWLVGVGLMLIRIAIDLAAGRQLVRSGRPVELRLHGEITELANRLSLRRAVRPVWTDRMRVPAVYGAIRPVLLLPAILMQVPPEHFEAIVAHELAHLKRYDWLWHLAGRTVEAILFFNPAVWWISRLASREREAAADAIAVAATGRPAIVAHALADWAGTAAVVPATAVAWTGDSGSLRDRIIRILAPSERPPIRLSPMGLATALLAAALVMTGLWGGAQTVVAVAQDLLSPSERIERVEGVRREVERPEANPSGQRTRITVSGRVQTIDGGPPAEVGQAGHRMVSIRSHFSRGPASSSGGYTGAVGADGEFTATVGEGEITVTADWDGYAPAMVGPLRPPPEGVIKDIEVVVSPGFTGRVQLVGPAGETAAGAKVEARLDAPANSQPRRHEAGADGIARIEHAARHPYAITITAPGYERETFHDVRLKPDETVTLTLTPTEPATGTVTDVQGEKIANAELRLFARSPKPGSIHTYHHTGPVLATTDAAGHFTIDTLPTGERTVVLVVADGHGSEVREIAAGESAGVIQLGPERILRGEIHGDLSKLNARYHGQPSLEYSVRVPLFDGPQEFDRFVNQGNLAPVDPLGTPAGEPGRATFELSDLLPGELTITAGPAKRVFEPFDGRKEGVVIDLAEPASGGPPRRDVVLRFVTPEPDDPPPTGDLRLTLKPLEDEDDRSFEQFRRGIEEGRIEIEAFAPGTVHLQNQGMIGYWFDEAVVGTVGNYRALLVPEGEEPFQFTIPVTPAGAIRGRIVAHDGSVPEDPQEIDLQCYRVPRERRGPETISSATVHPNTDGEFLITPVPLGGRYRIVADVDFSVTKIFSDSVSPTAAEPMQEVALRLPELFSATVRVVDAEGRPAADRRVSIRRSYPEWFTTSSGRRTDETGRVSFGHLAIGAAESYRVSVTDERHRPIVEAPLQGPKRETVLKLPESAAVVP